MIVGRFISRIQLGVNSLPLKSSFGKLSQNYLILLFSLKRESFSNYMKMMQILDQKNLI